MRRNPKVERNSLGSPLTQFIWENFSEEFRLREQGSRLMVRIYFLTEPLACNSLSSIETSNTKGIREIARLPLNLARKSRSNYVKQPEAALFISTINIFIIEIFFQVSTLVLVSLVVYRRVSCIRETRLIRTKLNCFNSKAT